MLTKLKNFLPISTILITAFSPVKNEYVNTDSYYKLRFLKESSYPRKMTIINLYNTTYKEDKTRKGILITYKNRSAKKAQISGDFSNWSVREMNRGKFGVWYYFLSGYYQREEIRYKFLVDGIWITDPKNNNKVDDGMGSDVSIIHLDSPAEGKHLTYKFIDKNLVEFRIYKPRARLIALIGDFNNWNPENDLLKKGKDGVWRLEKILSEGTYRYKFIIDGEWVVDIYNEISASDGIGDICSVINVE